MIASTKVELVELSGFPTPHPPEDMRTFIERHVYPLKMAEGAVHVARALLAAGNHDGLKIALDVAQRLMEGK